MNYRILGSTGLKVSVIGLGTWQFGGEWGRAFAQTDADAILDAAAQAGINLLDTAECYGDHLSERLIGDYLSRHDRSRWIVATKFGHHFNRFMDRTDDFSPAGARAQLEASLRALRVDAIDLYQFHSGSDAAFLNEELWSFLNEQRRAGKIRHLGVSILGKGSELQARDARRFGAEALQVIYNRLDRRPEQTVFRTPSGTASASSPACPSRADSSPANIARARPSPPTTCAAPGTTRRCKTTSSKSNVSAKPKSLRVSR